jgi:hypothetical protein
VNPHEDFLRYNQPDITEAEIEAVAETLRLAGWRPAPRPRVRRGLRGAAARSTPSQSIPPRPG